MPVPLCYDNLATPAVCSVVQSVTVFSGSSSEAFFYTIVKKEAFFILFYNSVELFFIVLVFVHFT